MIAAIYGKIDRQHGVSDEQKPVARQVEHARAFAAARAGGPLPTSTSTSTRHQRPRVRHPPRLSPPDERPQAEAAFQVLILSEESRLGREQIEFSWLKQLVTRGVRVFCYLTCRNARSIGRWTERSSHCRA
jgi:hypothetical protein